MHEATITDEPRYKVGLRLEDDHGDIYEIGVLGPFTHDVAEDVFCDLDGIRIRGLCSGDARLLHAESEEDQQEPTIG